jgi:hypothetical protein
VQEDLERADRILKRRRSHTEADQRNKKSRSQQLTPNWDIDYGLGTTDIAEDTGHELQTSTAESASEVDWGSFLCLDELLAPSNWEEEFVKHKEKMMAHPYGYKGLVDDDGWQESAESEDEPWYPYDPENMLNQDSEMKGVILTSEIEGQTKICYGMVSIPAH